MIAALAAAGGVLGRLPWQLYAVAAIAGAAWWGAGHYYDRGRADCEAEVRAAADGERARQAEANAAALKTGAEIVSDLAAENDTLRSTLEEIADAARSDPDRDACGLSSDSLRLLDRIGGSADPGGPAVGPHPGL